MKRGSLLRHLRKHGCYLKREGREHSLWCNPATGEVEAVPRHTDKLLAESGLEDFVLAQAANHSNALEQEIRKHCRCTNYKAGIAS